MEKHRNLYFQKSLNLQISKISVFQFLKIPIEMYFPYPLACLLPHVSRPWRQMTKRAIANMRGFGKHKIIRIWKSENFEISGFSDFLDLWIVNPLWFDGSHDLRESRPRPLMAKCTPTNVPGIARDHQTDRGGQGDVPGDPLWCIPQKDQNLQKRLFFRPKFVSGSGILYPASDIHSDIFVTILGNNAPELKCNFSEQYINF